MDSSPGSRFRVLAVMSRPNKTSGSYFQIFVIRRFHLKKPRIGIGSDLSLPQRISREIHICAGIFTDRSPNIMSNIAEFLSQTIIDWVQEEQAKASLVRSFPWSSAPSEVLQPPFSAIFFRKRVQNPSYGNFKQQTDICQACVRG